MKALILFDGVCNLCNGAVQFIIRSDSAFYFRFASLQSEAANKVLKDVSSNLNPGDSIVLVENGNVYTKADAVLRIARKLSGFSKLLYGFIIVPRFIRNAAYDMIAKNRYRWFGRRQDCMIPSPALKERFLE